MPARPPGPGRRRCHQPRSPAAAPPRRPRRAREPEWRPTPVRGRRPPTLGLRGRPRRRQRRGGPHPRCPRCAGARRPSHGSDHAPWPDHPRTWRRFRRPRPGRRRVARRPGSRDQVDAERPVSALPHPPDPLAESALAQPRPRQHPQRAGIADRGSQLRGCGRPDGRLRDRYPQLQPATQRSSEHAIPPSLLIQKHRSHNIPYRIRSTSTAEATGRHRLHDARGARPIRPARPQADALPTTI